MGLLEHSFRSIGFNFSKNPVRQITTNDQLDGVDPKLFRFDGRKSPLALAFISPHADFAEVTQRLTELGGGTPIVAATTAGELCSQSDSQLYLDTPDGWRTVVVQIFSPRLIEQVDIFSVPLHCRDIRGMATTVLDHDERVDTIAADLAKIIPSFRIDARDCFALSLIDGLSKSENYFMEAIYRSARFPCMFVGGSAGGKLDFLKTYLYDGAHVLENHAVVVFVKLAPGQRYGLFKSQNFRRLDRSFIVVEADVNQRTVQSVFDKSTGTVCSFIEALCRLFDCRPGGLQAALGKKAFGIEIDGEIFVRSVADLDFTTSKITFYCDIAVGDQLVMLEETDFVAQTNKDIAAYLKGKPKPSAVIMNDCILRRLSNTGELARMRNPWPAPAAGFSTFGELFGININQTLSAIVFFSDVGEDYRDPLIDNFPVHYAKFSNYFNRRNLMRIERARMRQELQRAFGEVVDSAVAGDFSKRVTVQFPDAELNRLSANVNTLVETVDRGLGETGAVLAALADADLTRMVTASYQGRFAELKEAINGTIERLSKTLHDIQSISGDVTLTAREITTGANDLSQRTEEQASNLEETAATTEQLAASVKASAQAAHQATQIANHAKDAANTGAAIVGDAVDAMARIEEASQQISDIIRVIDDIAFQTNLLALNAAVEAARAGDAGKGFAVVASEVRTLAQRSSEAAKDISGLISSSNAKVSEGVKLVRAAGDALLQIKEASQRVSATIAEISTASSEQANGIDEMSQTVAHLDEMTQQNAALAEESAASANILTKRIAGLQESLARFRTKSAPTSAMPDLQSRQVTELGRVTKAMSGPITTPRAGHPRLRAAGGWDEF
jgi:methyl-accepting chemotaxis protein